MEDASRMTLLQAVSICDEVTPSPATAHQAMNRLCSALADALCVPRAALKSYAAELEAASIENMPAGNVFVLERPEDDKLMTLPSVPMGIPPLQVGLLASLVGMYEGTPVSLDLLANDLHRGDVDQLRAALVGLQSAGYVRFAEDQNALLVRSERM